MTSEQDPTTGLHASNPGLISTWTGRFVDPLDMQVEDVVLADIAHALSRQCRYNGHCEGFISVARHCLWVAQRLPLEFAMWGLLHDASEAYLGDMPRPFKYSDDMQLFRDAETRLEQVVAERFNLVWPMPPEVIEADRQVLLEVEMPDKRLTYHGDYALDERHYLGEYEILRGLT